MINSAKRAKTEPLPAPLAELILAVIAFDDSQHGAELARRIRPVDFDGEAHRKIATEAIHYRRDYGKAPSKAELCSLVVARRAHPEAGPARTQHITLVGFHHHRT